jgi:hypothetical protein
VIVLLATLTFLALLSACQSAPEPATPLPPTAPAATPETGTTPQATATAEHLPFDGAVDIEVSAESEGALAFSTYSLEVLRESLRENYSFSQDLTLLLIVDGEGRALLMPADEEAIKGLSIRHRDQTSTGATPAASYEVNGDGVLFLPMKGGTILMTEASKEGSIVSWGISNQPGVRGGNEIIAYRIEETNRERVYVITHRVDSAGNWVKLATPERLSQSETIFAEAGEAAEVVEAEPLDWQEAMGLLFNGYEVIDSKEEVRQMPGYDFDHPVFDETDSEGTRFSIYCETTMYRDGERPTIALSEELGGNVTLVNQIKDWWRRYQAAYNQGMGGSKEGIEGAYITAIDPARLRQFSGETAPISPLRNDGEGAPLREMPFDLSKVSRVIFLRGISRSSKPIDMGDRFSPIIVDGKKLDVYHATATVVEAGNNISTAMVFPDLDDLNGEKMVLVFMSKGNILEDGILGTYGHIGRLVNQIRYLFLPRDQVSVLTNNILGGNGRSLESQANYSGDIQKLTEGVTAEISAELAKYDVDQKFMYSKR